MTPDPLSIYEWQEPNFRAVNKFYKKQKHKGSASGEERVFVITENQCLALEPAENNNITILAAVRLVPAHGYYWLRSLYVEKGLRGQKLGSRLMAFVNDQVDIDIHCFPYPHLQPFYTQSGYGLTPLTTAPEPLQQLYQRYNRKGDSILFMSRLAI
jgi:GNAT superfamily N-acetyltransferase